jgi:hypothetical protein
MEHGSVATMFIALRREIDDTSFLDPNRLPPGTPFAHNIQLTGFQRLN